MDPADRALYKKAIELIHITETLIALNRGRLYRIDKEVQVLIKKLIVPPSQTPTKTEQCITRVLKLLEEGDMLEKEIKLFTNKLKLLRQVKNDLEDGIDPTINYFSSD